MSSQRRRRGPDRGSGRAVRLIAVSFIAAVSLGGIGAVPDATVPALPTASSGRLTRTPKPPPGRGPAVAGPAVQGRALADADQPASRGGPGLAGRRRGLAVIGDLQDEPGRAVADGHLGRLRPGVLERVRQGLLHDPVGGQVQPGGQVRRGAVDPGGHGQAGGPDPGQQLAQAGQSRRRRPAVRLAGLRADGRQHPAELGQGLPARRADRAQRLPGRLRAGAEHVLGGAGLDDDHAEGVGDDVVQLAPDPGLLLGDRPPGLQFLLAAAVGGAGPQLTEVGAGQPPGRQETQDEHHAQGVTVAVEPERPGQDGPGGDARPGRLPPRAVRGHRVQRHQHANRPGNVGVPGDRRAPRGRDRRAQRGRDHHGQHPDRAPPPERQRQRLQQGKGDAGRPDPRAVAGRRGGHGQGRQGQCQRGIARDEEPPSPPWARPRIRLSVPGPHAHQATPPRPGGHQASRVQVRQAPAAGGTRARAAITATGPGRPAHIRFFHRCRLPR